LVWFVLLSYITEVIKHGKDNLEAYTTIVIIH